jgi:predicted metal-dependent phosphoesterase TrpH
MSDQERFDLHLHSRYSPDSQVPIVDLVERASIAGFKGVALTDHNTIAGIPRLRELQSRYPRMVLVPGIEVSTSEGHLLIYGIQETPPIRRPLGETIEWANAHGGIPVPSHPLRWTHGIGYRRAETVRVPALEATNGHNGEVANARAELLAARRAIGATGGSDAHGPAHVGRAYTWFPDECATVDDVLDQLGRGRCHSGGSGLAGRDRFSVALRTLGRRIRRGFRGV